MRMATDAPTAAPSRTEMSSAPSEADVETLLSQRLLQGFLLLEQPCPVCATPLVRQEDPLPSDDNASAVSAIEPIQGVPFCVCCRAHVVTQESEIALLSGDSVDENESGVGHKPRPVKGSILVAVPSHSVTPPVASQGGQRDQGDDFEEDFLEILTENDSTIATVEDVKETKPQSIERPHVAPEPHTKPSPPTGRSVDSSTQATAKVSQVVLDDLNEDSIELVRQPTMASVQGEIDRDDEIVCTTDDQDKEILEIEVITKVHSMLDAMEELTVDGSYMAGSVYNSEDEHHGDENGEETEFIVGLQKEKEMSAGVTTEDAKSSNTSDKSGKPSRESLSPSARIAQRNLLDSRHLVSEEDRPYWPDYAERRQIATKILADKMMEGLELREEQCQRCSMPIMNEGQSDSSGFCTVCPVLDENMAKKRLEDETQVELARRRVVQEEEKQRLAQKKLELEKSIDIQRKLRAKKHSKLDQVKSRAVSMALVVAASTTSVEVTTANNKSSKVSPSSQSPSSVETPALGPKQEKDEASKAAMDSVDAPQEERQGQNSKAADNIEKDEESTLQQAKTTGAQSISTNPTAVSTLVQANTMSDIHTPKLMELNVKTVEVPDVSMQRSVVTRDLQPADCVEATLGPLKFLDSDHFSVIPPLPLQKMKIEKEAAHLLREVGKAEEAKRESLRVLDEATKAHTEKKNRAVELTEEIAREQTLVLKETERLQQLEAQQLEQNRTRTSRSASISNKDNEELKLQAEIEKAEKARDAAEFERQRLADEKQALEESNLLSELEKDANKKQREAEEAMGRAKAAIEKVVAVQRKIFAKTIAAGEVSVVAEAEKISRADTEDYHERNIKPSASEVCRERWETLRCESKAVRTRRLLSGWTTLPELCRGQECQSSPLITNSEEKECVVCGGCGSGRDGAYAQMINGDDESEDGCSQIILLQETTPSVLSFPTDFAGTFSVEEHTTAILSPTPRKCVEEIHKDFERKRNAVSKEIGKKMLQGWILLDLSCPNCVMPLMTDGDGEREICILCGDVGQFGNYDDSTKATSVATTVDKTVPYAQLNASDKIEVMSSRDCSTVGLNTLSTKENRKISCVLSTHTSREAAEIPRAAVESAKKNAKGAHSVESQVPCKNQQSTGDEVNSLSITANSGPNYVKKTGNAAKTRLPAVVEEDRTSLETSLCPSRSRIESVESKSAPGKGKLQTHRKLDPSPRSSFNQKKPNACKEPPSTIKSPTVRSFSDSCEMSKRIQGSHQRRHRKDPEVLVTSTSAETKVVEPASSMDLSLGGDLASSTIASPSSIRNKAGRTQSDTKRSAANSISHILSPKNRHRSETLRGDPPAIQGCSLGRRNAKEVEGRRADELPTEHSKTTHDTPTSEGDSQSKVEWTRKLAESNDENREIAAEGTDDHPIRDKGRFETNECIRGSEDNNGVQQIPIDFNRGIEQPIGDLITVAKARQPCYTDMSVRTPMDDQSSKGIPLHALHLPSPGMTAASAPYLSPTSYRESAPASVAPTLGSFRPRITPETSRRDRKRTLLSGLRPAFPYQSGILHSKAKPPQSDFVVYGGPLETPELLVTGTNASVTSEAIDTLLARIEETKAQLEEHPDGDNLENQNRLSQLLANLASAAEAMQRFDELEAIDRFDEMTDTWCRSAERI